MVFNGKCYRSLGSWDKNVLKKNLAVSSRKDIFHVVSQNYEIERSYNFMNRTSSLYGINHAKFRGNRFSGNRDKMLLICRVM